jgi:hypothetical protein
MKLGMGVAALVGALAVGGLPAAAGVFTGATPGTAPSATRTEQGELRRGHGPPDHAKAYGLRAQGDGGPRADTEAGPGKGLGHGPGHEVGRRHGQRMSALGRRHGEQMRAWGSCVRRHQKNPATCGDKPTPPGHLKHAGPDHRGPHVPQRR